MMPLAVVMLLFIVSASAQQSPVQSSNSPTAVSEITVERKGCYGGCPIYVLTLRRQGPSTYVEKTSVVRHGQYTVREVYAGEFDRLSKAILDLRFFDLQDVYNPGTVDAERVTVTVATPSKSKTVTTFNFAKAPYELWQVVTLADGVAANLYWEKEPRE